MRNQIQTINLLFIWGKNLGYCRKDALLDSEEFFKTLNPIQTGLEALDVLSLNFLYHMMLS